MERYYDILGLGCAHCGGKIEEAINKLEEVENAVLNFPMKRLKVKGKHSDELLAKMNELARNIEPDVEIVASQEQHHEHHHDHEGECCEHEHHHHHHEGECCDHEHHHDECCEHEHHHEHSHEHHEGVKLTVNDLGCAHCGGKIAEAIGQLEGVEAAELNFPMRQLIIHGKITDELLEKMNSIAGQIEPGVTITAPKTQEKEAHHEHGTEMKKELAEVAVGVLLFAAALIVHKAAHIMPLAIVLYAAAYLVLGRGVLAATLKNIRVKNFFDENTLMTVATLGAFALGEYAEAVGVVLFFKIGEIFEDHAVAKSRKAITDVAGLRVDEADVLRDGQFVRISSDQIRVGDILQIKAGERIAADGIVEAADHGVKIDTSAVNGEPVPMVAYTGDSVLSGCISLSDTFRLRVTAAAEDSMISKIARAVEDASAEKPKIDRFITRFSKVYTPIVIAVAVLTAVVGSLVTGDWSKWIYSALTFLVISCPCALVLSVPLAYFSGIGAASKLGILFKGGDSIEALGKVKAIAFDKTGTLTDGTFMITDIKTYGGVAQEELLRICGSCEQVSTHPVAERIAEHCRSNGIALSQPESSEELAGRGISAMLDGKLILCGNERLMGSCGVQIPAEESGLSGSVVYVAADGQALGRIVVSDTVKKTSQKAVSALKAKGCRTAMFTGDKTANAQAVGSQLGIDEIRAELMPDEKLAQIGALREKYGPVMFVGDGINDAPVLAGADVGGAMQTGADLALEASDVVFMNSEPESVARAKRIADKTLRISYENIIFALGIKLAVLVLGLLGHPNMWLAVFADSGTAMLLVLNSIRALSTRQYK